MPGTPAPSTPPSADNPVYNEPHPPSHYIDHRRYTRLPPAVRAELIDWLKRQNLWEQRIMSFTLLEGAIRATVPVLDPDTGMMIPIRCVRGET